MPIRSIAIPAPAHLIDPATRSVAHVNGEPVMLSFGLVLERLLSNPSWSESYDGVRSQLAVRAAWDRADGELECHGPMLLAEDDWARLKACIETPRMLTPDGRAVAGYGFHPSLSAQLAPYLTAVIDAK